MAKHATIGEIIKGAKKYLPNLDEQRVMRAYEFAKKAHENQTRGTGEAYIHHPLEVTKILLELRPDEDSIVASLLHDVLEDTHYTAEDLRKEFDEGIMPLLKGLEKLETIYYHGKERQIENLRKMFLAMAKDIRVILIKLADRLHNMRTLDGMSEEKQRRIAEETLSIYSPIASRLGIYELKNELDDLCFRYLHAKQYETLKKEMAQSAKMQERVLKKSKINLMHTLKKAGIKAEIEGRMKHLYSIYRKLQRKNKNYASELYDIFALRIIVESEADCYQTLGVVHKNWTPLQRRFKDYIANAKENGYQSLHTTVVGLCNEVNNQPVEIQIRTKEMDIIAQYGVAAHWKYKEKGVYSIAVPEGKLSWIKGLVDLHESLKNNNEFLETLHMDVLSDRIFVLTPKGDILDLPRGATPVDFAYNVHTDVGHRCKGAKVNGAIVPLDQKLENGQVVEVLTGTVNKPNRYWLSYVVSSHAKSAIKQWFGAQERDNLIKMGKELMNKHLKRFGQAPLSPDLKILQNYDEERWTLRRREELLEKMGNGSVDVMSVIKRVLPLEKRLEAGLQNKPSQEALKESISFEDTEVLITGEKGYQTQIATCCMPTTKDPIIGYITRGRGVTIHKQGCKVLRGNETKRLIRASWATQKNPAYKVKLAIRRISRIGMLRDIANVFTKNEVPILDFTNMPEKSEMGVTFSIDSLDTLNTIIHELEELPGVFKVTEMQA